MARRRDRRRWRRGRRCGVAEGSGRPVERRLTRDVAPAGPVIGIKPLFDDDVLPKTATAGFELIALDQT